MNGPYERHAFVCLGGKSCPALGSEAVFAALKAKVADASLRDRVRVNKAGCMSQCGNGPMVCLYPDNVWYAGVRPEDADAINHYPELRHGGVYNVVFCDGHVEAMQKNNLRREMYYVFP